MNMIATMENNMLHSIVEQAISLPAPLRLVLGDQESRRQNQVVSLHLSDSLREIKPISQSAANLRRRAERLRSARFTVKEEVDIDAAATEAVRICKRLKNTFTTLCQNHFWLKYKGNKINRLLDAIETDVTAIHTHLQRFYAATDWQRSVATASRKDDWGQQLADNSLIFSAHDFDAFEKALDDEPVLTPAQIKAQQHFIALKKAS